MVLPLREVKVFVPSQDYTDYCIRNGASKPVPIAFRTEGMKNASERPYGSGPPKMPCSPRKLGPLFCTRARDNSRVFLEETLPVDNINLMEVLIGLSEINYGLYETDHTIYGYANYGNEQDDVNYAPPTCPR
jgi:hypothetical protein